MLQIKKRSCHLNLNLESKSYFATTDGKKRNSKKKETVVSINNLKKTILLDYDDKKYFNENKNKNYFLSFAMFSCLLVVEFSFNGSESMISEQIKNLTTDIRLDLTNWMISFSQTNQSY